MPSQAARGRSNDGQKARLIERLPVRGCQGIVFFGDQFCPNHSTYGVISRKVCKRRRYACHPDCDDVSMPHKKSRTRSDDATRASVTKEMAKPRMARSAKVAELNLDTSRIPERPSTTMPGTVNKIIPSPHMSQPEKAQIAVDGTGRYRNLRIENTLTDEHGDDVKLKKGAHVDVTVTAKADRN
jgi:hypothetical protein